MLIVIRNIKKKDDDDNDSDDENENDDDDLIETKIILTLFIFDRNKHKFTHSF